MNNDTKIPYIFHFVFGLKNQTEPFHLMYYLCLKSCIEVNRPDAIFFHYNHEPYGPWWERIKPHLTLKRIHPDQFVQTYHYNDKTIEQFRYAHLSDFSRLEILLEYGGIYADIDTIFIKPLPQELLTKSFVMGHEKPPPQANKNGSLCNAWIACEKDAPFCRIWLDRMQEAFDGTWSNHSTLLPWRLSQEFPDLIHIEPESTFFALDWTAKNVNRLFLGDVLLPDSACSLHLWNHLWYDKKRLDFSPFHADMFTIDYVAHAQTTYAKLARNLLPPDCTPSFWRYHQQRLQFIFRYYSRYRKLRREMKSSDTLPKRV